MKGKTEFVPSLDRPPQRQQPRLAPDHEGRFEEFSEQLSVDVPGAEQGVSVDVPGAEQGLARLSLSLTDSKLQIGAQAIWQWREEKRQSLSENQLSSLSGFTVSCPLR